MDKDYLTKLFIDEAKPSLSRHSGSGGSSGDLVECESLPTEGVSDDKIYRARWSETKEIPTTYEVYVFNGSIVSLSERGVAVNVAETTDEIPEEPTSNTVYVCLADGKTYLNRYTLFVEQSGLSSDADFGFINSPDELDTSRPCLGVVKTDGGLVTTNHVHIGASITDSNAILYEHIDGKWRRVGLVANLFARMSPREIFSEISTKTLDGLIGYADTSSVTNMGLMFYKSSKLTTVPEFDTSSVTDMESMFQGCTALTSVPEFDTSSVTNMGDMFSECKALTTVPEFDTSSVTNMGGMFFSCKALTSVPEFDTSSVTDMDQMFYNCTNLTTVPEFDIRNVTTASLIFYRCTNLTSCRLKNIKTNLEVGSGKSYGHLLTVDSLIHLIYELRKQSSSKTLTVGTANLSKLASVYVKLVDITDEMRAADDLIDEKYPFVVCESTDEGAMLITNYATTIKSWTIK